MKVIKQLFLIKYTQYVIEDIQRIIAKNAIIVKYTRSVFKETTIKSLMANRNFEYLLDNGGIEKITTTLNGNPLYLRAVRMGGYEKICIESRVQGVPQCAFTSFNNKTGLITEVQKGIHTEFDNPKHVYAWAEDAFLQFLYNNQDNLGKNPFTTMATVLKYNSSFGAAPGTIPNFIRNLRRRS